MFGSKWCSVYFRAFLVSCAVALTLAGPGAYGAEVVHGNDVGGLLGEYVEKYRAMAARGDRLVVDGACYSACTLALGIVDVCATPRASFGFHMAQSVTLFGYFPSYYWSHYMMAYYPPEIRAWIVSKGGLTPELKILRGEELAALVPTCSEEGTTPEDGPAEPAPVYESRVVQSSPLPPPSTVYRDSGYRGSQQGYYRDPPAGGGGQGFAPAVVGTRPYYSVPGAIPPGPAGSAEQDAIRQEAMWSRLPGSSGQIRSGENDPRTTGSISSDPHRVAALPPEVRPETGPNKEELAPQFRRTLVDYYAKEPTGTIIVDTPNTYLYLVLGNGKALRYGVGVGREGFTWSGAQQVTKMAEWPDWNPPEEMIVRQPYLPRFMAGGETNPLGARALYLGNTVYRIHGTNQPSTIGTFVSSGCIRLTNEDVMDLYSRVRVGTRVVVLSGRPSTAATNSFASPSAMPPGTVTAASPGPVSSPMAR
jgi:lipoprotein-anchoring transpeptidase ErfK/SrfK